MVSTEDKYRFTCTHGIYCSERSLLNSMFSNIRQEWKSNWLSEVAENTVILSSQVTSLKYLVLEKRKATLKTLTHMIRTMCLLESRSHKSVQWKSWAAITPTFRQQEALSLYQGINIFSCLPEKRSCLFCSFVVYVQNRAWHIWSINKCLKEWMSEQTILLFQRL